MNETTYTIRVGADGATKGSFDNYGEAWDAAKMLSLSSGILKAEIRHCGECLIKFEAGEVIWTRPAKW